MTDSPTCKRCGGRVNAMQSRAWCMKPTLDGGCGQAWRYDDDRGRWVFLYRGKVARIVPIVKDKPKKEVQHESVPQA